MSWEIKENEIKAVVRTYYTNNTICGFCNAPFELFELNEKGRKKWGYRYVLVRYYHTHGLQGWGNYSVTPIRFYNDIEKAPRTTKECFEIVFNDAKKRFKETYGYDEW